MKKLLLPNTPPLPLAVLDSSIIAVSIVGSSAVAINITVTFYFIFYLIVFV